MVISLNKLCVVDHSSSQLYMLSTNKMLIVSRHCQHYIEWSRKMHKCWCTVILQSCATESRGFHQNAHKRSMSTSHCRICISCLNILW